MSLTARQAVTRALKELQYYAEGEDPSAAAISDGLDALNAMMYAWQGWGITLAYPSATRWRGNWDVNNTYAIGDGVTIDGLTFVCILAHYSTTNDRPPTTPLYATYWSYTASTALPLTLDVAIPLNSLHDRGVVSLLAMEMAPLFSVQASPITAAKAQAGWSMLLKEFFTTPGAKYDLALQTMPSQRFSVSGVLLPDGNIS